MSQAPYDYSTRQGVHPVSWEDFHGICKALALATALFRPEIVLPIGRGGYYPGTLLAHMLRVEIYPVRVSRRVNDVAQHETPQWMIEPPVAVAGRRVLIVDEICDAGETILIVKRRVAALGASSVKSAVLYAHTRGAHVPDYIGLVTDALVLNPWDREILRDGKFQFHPEYVEALSHLGLQPTAQMLIAASPIRLARG